jgi:hypothetical protein
MGRPLNKKYFGNTNLSGTGVGGTSVASIALGTAGSGYSQGVTVTLSAPQLPGVTATASVQVNPSTGAVTSYTVLTAGSGYTSAPTATLVTPAQKTPTGTGVNAALTITVSSVAGIFAGMTVSGINVGTNAKVVSFVASTKVVTVSVANSAAITAGTTITFTDDGTMAAPGNVALIPRVTEGPQVIIASAFTGSSSKVADIVKQVGGRRYKINTVDTAGTPIIAKLVATDATAVGEMTIKAYDVNENAYYVTKLTAHKALLTQLAGGSNYVYASGETAPWKFDGPVGIYVQIENA